MDIFSSCKFFYLSGTTLTPKGELPIYACKKGYHIQADCNESCQVYQKIQRQKSLEHITKDPFLITKIIER